MEAVREKHLKDATCLSTRLSIPPRAAGRANQRMSGDSSLHCSGKHAHARCCEDAHCRRGDMHRAQPAAMIQIHPEAAVSMRPLVALLPPTGTPSLVPLSRSLLIESWSQRYGCREFEGLRFFSGPQPPAPASPRCGNAVCTVCVMAICTGTSSIVPAGLSTRWLRLVLIARSKEKRHTGRYVAGGARHAQLRLHGGRP